MINVRKKRTAMKMMSWKKIQHRRHQDSDENDKDQQETDVKLIQVMQM